MARTNKKTVPTIQIGGRTFAFHTQDDLDRINDAIACLHPVTEKWSGDECTVTELTEKEAGRMVATLTFGWE